MCNFSYADIGGLATQIQEIKVRVTGRIFRVFYVSVLQEAVELPLTHPEYYEEMGIKPPKGVILYGQPGTGKTLLAKAVANQTSATFLRVVGSELIQKYLVNHSNLSVLQDALISDRRVMDRNWFENCSEWPKNTLQPLSSSMKSMRSERNGWFALLSTFCK